MLRHPEGLGDPNFVDWPLRKAASLLAGRRAHLEAAGGNEGQLDAGPGIDFVRSRRTDRRRTGHDHYRHRNESSAAESSEQRQQHATTRTLRCLPLPHLGLERGVLLADLLRRK